MELSGAVTLNLVDRRGVPDQGDKPKLLYRWEHAIGVSLRTSAALDNVNGMSAMPEVQLPFSLRVRSVTERKRPV